MSDKSYHHGSLREALLNAADRILEAEGLESLSLRAVARAAKVSQAAPYHHFRNKDDLLDAVSARGFERLHDMQTQFMARHTEPGERLRANGAAYVLFSVRNPALFRLMFGPAYAMPAAEGTARRAAGNASFGTLIEAIDQVIAARGLDHNPLEFALKSWATVHGLAHLLIDCRTLAISRAILGLPEDAALSDAQVIALVGKVTAI